MIVGVGEEGEVEDRREAEEDEPKGHNNRLSDLLNPEKSAELIHEPLVEVNVQEVTERYHANYNYEQMGPPNYQQYPYDYHPQIQIQYSSERPVYDPAYVPGGESYQYMYHDQQGYRQYSVYDYNDPQMEKQDSNEQLENENELLLPRPIMKVPIVQPRPTIMSPTSNNYEGPRVARIMVEPLNPSKQFSANERRESQSLPHVDEMEVDSTIDDPGRSIEEYSYMETSEQSLQDSMLPSANNSVESLDIHSNSRNLDSTVPQDSLLDTRDEDSMDVELPPILEPTESAEIAIELTEMESFHPDPADIAVDSSGQAKVMNANYQKDDTPPIIEKPREEPTVSSKNATESNDSTGIPLNQDQNPTETPKE